MEFTIDVDTGGTFTDGLIKGDGKVEVVKVDTTPHDLTVGFMNCIEEAAKRFGMESSEALLGQASVVRLSTTIGTNTLLQASGPKLGLLVTKGAEEMAYAPPDKKNYAIDFLVPRDMILGLNEEIDALGNSVKVPEQEEFLRLVKVLLERGARRIVLSLSRSPLNSTHEQRCKQMLSENFPPHYLGSIPLLSSTEVNMELDDFLRTNASLINAYIHREMVRYLYKADDDMRSHRYKWPLLVVHAMGGVARVSKTKAIDTLGSGPAAGLFGAGFMARFHGLEDVLTFDMGGTSTDVGFVSNGEPIRTVETMINNIPVRMPCIGTVSIGAGGGSIATPVAGAVQVSPRSAGSIPGPACYGLGGTEATVTDAWVALGYLDPTYFLGGKRILDKAKAESILKKKIADPLKISVTEAAMRITQELQSKIVTFVKDQISSQAKEAGKMVMFGYGGGSGLCCWNIAKAVGIPQVYIFPFGAAFSAFGSSCMDMLHSYDLVKRLELSDDVAEEFNRSLRSMMENAYIDMEGEGLKREKVSLMLEAVMDSEDSPVETVVRWPAVQPLQEGIKVLRSLYEDKKGIKACGKVFIKKIRLTATCPLSHVELSTYTSAGENPKEALKGERQVFLAGKLSGVGVYEQKMLRSGNAVKGPALIESETTCVFVPLGITYRVDQYLNGIMGEA